MLGFPSPDLDAVSPEAGGRRVLVVDDDPALRRVVRAALQRDGFDVVEAGDGPTALEAVEQDRPQLLILDVTLPAQSGFDILTELRRRGCHVPVIVLSGRGEELDRILGLELGADDYMVKPFAPRELAARVRAVLRRSASDVQRSLDFGDLQIDEASRTVWKHGDLVPLRAREFDLLVFLARTPRRVYSRAELLREVWHSASEWQDESTVTEHIRRLRSKLEDDREHPRWIRTARAAGYAFEP